MTPSPHNSTSYLLPPSTHTYTTSLRTLETWLDISLATDLIDSLPSAVVPPVLPALGVDAVDGRVHAEEALRLVRAVRAEVVAPRARVGVAAGLLLADRQVRRAGGLRGGGAAGGGLLRCVSMVKRGLG